MKILVTGGAGYIGSHTCVELLQAGHEVVVMDNFYNSKPEVLETVQKLSGKTFRFYEADMRDTAALDQIFSENQLDAVVHFAGLKAVGESVKEPLLYYETNLGGSTALFRAMSRHGVKRLVFSSSATVYGMNNPIPYKEGYPTSAASPYGWTKLMIEQILSDIARSDPEWSVCLLRYFNPIGAHESGLIGEDPNGIPNNLLPYIMQVAVGKLPELSVYGDDYDTPDGTGVRDYIHVVDLAKGHVAALKYAAAHTGCIPVNLGTGRGTSVLEIVHAFEKASGQTIPYRIAPRRAGDIGAYYADTQRAKALFSWTAQRDIDAMCQDSWRYARHRYSR